MSTAKKTKEKVVEAEVVDTPVATQSKTEPQRKTWGWGSVFWGLLFILVGVLLLLDNLGVVEVNFSNIWQLWPVLIVGTGVSMLSLRGWLGGIVTFILVAATLGLVGFAVLGSSVFIDDTTSVEGSIPRGTEVKSLDINIDTGAASINLSSNTNQSLDYAQEGDDSIKVDATSSFKSDVQYVNISTNSDKMFWLGNFRNDLTFSLPQSLPVALTIDAGASSLKGDLSQVQLSKLTVDMGASSIDLKLGALAARQTISFDTGASSIKLKIPTASGVRVETDQGLSDVRFEGVDKQSDNVYQSANFASAPQQITIQAKLGISSFRIERY